MTSWVDPLAARLAAAGVGDYATDRALDPAKPAITLLLLPESPDAAAALTPYPGPEPDSREGDEYPRLQVRVRAGDVLAALDLDRDVFDVLQAVPGMFPITLGGWVLTDCYALQSEPMPMSQDENGRPEYVRNYQLTVHTV